MRAKSFFTSISCTIALALCSAVAIAAPTHLHALGQGGRLAGNLVILAAHGGFGMRHAMIGHPMMGHPMIGHSMIGRGVMGPRFIGPRFAHRAPFHVHNFHHHHRHFFFVGVPYPYYDDYYNDDLNCWWSRRYHHWVCRGY